MADISAEYRQCIAAHYGPGVQYVLLAVRVVLTVVFAASALSKLRPGPRRSLAAVLGQIKVVPEALTRWTAAALTTAELATAILLSVPQVYLWGLSASCVLLTVLTLGVAWILRRGEVIRCPCFGGTERLSLVHLIRNSALLSVSVIALATAGDGHASVSGLIVSGSAGFVIGLITTRADMLAELLVH